MRIETFQSLFNLYRKDRIMTNSSVSMMKKAVLAAALVAATAGSASADDSGMGRFSDSYQYFASQSIDKSASTWRAENPSGISLRQLQANSSWSEAWKTSKPVFDTTASQFEVTHPGGLSEREYQALSSPGPAWHSSPVDRAVTSSGQIAVVQGSNRETLAARVAQFFRPVNAVQGQ